MANPTFVQVVNSSAYGDFTVPITVTNAGDALVVVEAYRATGCSDDRGNKYQAVFIDNNLSVFVALNCPSGATTITVTGSYSRSLFVAEYTNVAAVRGVESLFYGIDYSGSGPYSITCGNIPTINNNDLIVGCFVSQQNTQTWTAGSGFTKRNAYPNTINWAALEDQLVSTAGSTAVAMTTDTAPSNQTACAIVLSSVSIPTVCVNKTYGGAGYGAHTSASTAAFPTTTGNGILVAISSVYAALTISSVGDTTGTNVYTAVPSGSAFNSGGVGSEVQFFFCPNATGNAANVVTANFSSANCSVIIYAWEIQSVQSPVAIDKASSGTGNSNTMAVASFTPSNNNDLIICVGAEGVGGADGHTYQPCSGYTYDYYATGGNVTAMGGYGVMLPEECILPTPSAQTPGIAVSATTQWAVAAVALTGTVASYTISDSLMMMGCGT